MRLLIICYHFPHFSEVKWPWATKEDSGRHENKTQISWLPVLSLCLFPEQPLGRQRSSVNYFVFIRVGIIVPFSPFFSQDWISSLVLNTDPSRTASVCLVLNIVSWTSVWQSLLRRCETDRETKWICSITQSPRYVLQLCWAVPRQGFSHWHLSSLITFPGQLFLSMRSPWSEYHLPSCWKNPCLQPPLLFTMLYAGPISWKPFAPAAVLAPSKDVVQ